MQLKWAPSLVEERKKIRLFGRVGSQHITQWKQKSNKNTKKKKKRKKDTEKK